VQNRFDLGVKCAQIVKLTKEVGDQFGVVGHVFEATDGLKLTREMIGDLAGRGLNIETAIPGATRLVVESIPAGTRMREGSIDKCEACPAKDEFARIKLGKSGFLRGKAAIRLAPRTLESTLCLVIVEASRDLRSGSETVASERPSRARLHSRPRRPSP
jgi:hypothetical protein